MDGAPSVPATDGRCDLCPMSTRNSNAKTTREIPGGRGPRDPRLVGADGRAIVAHDGGRRRFRMNRKGGSTDGLADVVELHLHTVILPVGAAEVAVDQVVGHLDGAQDEREKAEP